MADQRRRDAERAADQGDQDAAARLLLERVRAGELTHERLLLAAYLDDEPARRALADTSAVDEWVAAIPAKERRAYVQAVLRRPQVDSLPNGVRVDGDGSGELTCVNNPYPHRLVGDRWVERFACMSRLRILYLDGTKVTDLGLVHVGTLTRLEYLNLRDTAVTDAGLTHLHGLQNLVHLWLNYTTITGSGLASLKGHPRLKELFLENSSVDDGALAHLEGLPELEYLTLGQTRVTDRCLGSLATIPKLRYVDIGVTAVSDAAVRRFRPQANGRPVEFDHPD